MSVRHDSRSAASRGALEGQMLLAMPGMKDPRFARSVIYMCAHSDEGAMGIVVNHIAPSVTLPDLLVQLNIIDAEARITLPDTLRHVPVLRGGPVDTGRGFVLHSADYSADEATMTVDNGICLTATLDILKAMAHGGGPKRAALALGYAGWSPGQLENEIQANGWLHCPADTDLIFSEDAGGKYDRALRKLGIDLAMLSNSAGHA